MATPAWRSVSPPCAQRSSSALPALRTSSVRRGGGSASFNFPENGVELYAENVNNRGLCAIAQAESLRYKLFGGLVVRRACYGVLRFVMEFARVVQGLEVIVSAKLGALRAKSIKFKDGYMISSGHPVNLYIDSAVRHVLLRQDVLGIKVKIMLAWDPKSLSAEIPVA
ncbi:hypothetical protein GUJ93_ZPchr0013g35646 [Zizania palustris]|uniref:40S ribosomal protein S3 n=1 Tax=Zizania palustris TaxID=103762 RepID=A0A8J5X1I3_ZIZPA|nr:hypothetical protein GUJ93_ZPchr0013g35646 [Zizania palustris]KAG8099395.1 hypothetical protein GUJ93_ZPchr0013g35646 [Zizania palustris]